MLPNHSVQNGFLACIPAELQLDIFNRLDYFSVIHLASTNKYFSNLVDPQQLFKSKRAALEIVPHVNRYHLGCYRDDLPCEEEVIGFDYGWSGGRQFEDVRYCLDYVLYHGPIVESKAARPSQDPG